MNTNELPILSHILEIKYRIFYVIYSIIITSICGYLYKEEIFYLLSIPLGKSFIYTDVIEAFITYLKLALMTGIYLSYPLILYQTWSFIVPGLYIYEKKLYRIVVLLSIVLYFSAGYVGYYLLFPIAYAFFLGFQKVGPDKLFNIELQAKIHEYLLFNSKLIMALGITFQIPIIIFFAWIIYPRVSIWLVKRRRFVYVISFMIAAILSPPDILSQVVIAIPLILFFELSIFSIKILELYHKSLEAIGLEPTT